jgi:hypothetical protein
LFQDADFVEHRRMGDGAEDVVFPQTPVEGNGFSELRDIGGGAARETSAAGNGRFFAHKFCTIKTTDGRGCTQIFALKKRVAATRVL